MFTKNFYDNKKNMDARLRTDRSFDLLTRTLRLNGKEARLYFLDGMTAAGTLNKIISVLLQLPAESFAQLDNARAFADAAVPYGEVDVVSDEEDFVTFVLSGCVGLLLEGYAEALLIDVREYPQRAVTEPENDRVLRGAREGFIESLVSNTAMLRRRLRDPALTMELIQAGKSSRTDIVLCYFNGKASERILNRLRKKIKAVNVGTLTMGLESLTEALAPGQWWNPFPRARYTERPDAAAAAVAEGGIVLLCDHSPAALLLPTGIFDFLQDTNDYCFLPVTGAVLRWLRLLSALAATWLPPLWYFSLTHPDRLPEFLQFLKIHEPIKMPLLAQFLLIEFVIGALKLASLNTPSALSGSFAVIGALVLGEFAVRAELMVSEVVLVMAFVAIASFAQPSYELSYALSFTRIFALVLTAVFGLWGLLAGVLCTVLVISLTKTVAGGSYWYPLFPLNKDALLRLFLRRPLHKDNS